MNTANQKLVSWLFETKALRVCPQDKPFWYTSGTIGPYYINTHFLYGSEEKANQLLKIIDDQKNDVMSCPEKILQLTLENYKHDRIYSELIDAMCGYIKENIDIDEVDCISGGERRDWFFSLIIAHMMSKPHITIYKDLTAVISKGEKTEQVESLNGMNILHIADLITEASSYERAWIPALENRGAKLKWSVVVVDRKQGGAEFLSGRGIKPYSMIDVDKNLFNKALELELINVEQHAMIMDYIDNPKESMKRFLLHNPQFLKDALAADEKTGERARLCLEKNFYGLDMKL